jgi:porphyrinogen peroxidase
MPTAQFAIFAVGAGAHCYLEFDRRPGVEPRDFVYAMADIEEPHTTVGGVNIAVGIRPSLWSEVAPPEAVPVARDFEQAVVGPDGFAMPATQHDSWVWIAGAAADLVFDVATDVIARSAPVATVASEVTGWSYRHSRDLTGFEDGTENPPLSDAADVAIVPDGVPGAGASVVLVQQWTHNAAAWTALTTDAQERVIGRTKADSIEFDDDTKPADSHVARTVLEGPDGAELPIFRRNVPYGTVTAHGTLFVGFAADQTRLHRMLEQMAGVGDGIRDALTRYTTPVSGGYYVIASVEALRSFATPTVD